MTTMVPTDDGGLILIPAIYRDFVEVVCEAMAETLLPHRSFDDAICFEPGYNLPYGQISVELG